MHQLFKGQYKNKITSFKKTVNDKRKKIVYIIFINNIIINNIIITNNIIIIDIIVKIMITIMITISMITIRLIKTITFKK